MKAAKAFSSVWQDGKTELAKPVLADDVVSKDLLFGNEIKGYENWSKMVHGIFEVSVRYIGLSAEHIQSAHNCAAVCRNHDAVFSPIGDIVSDGSVMWSQDVWCLEQALYYSCCICSTDSTVASLLGLLLNRAGVDVWCLEQALYYSCCICSAVSTVASLLVLLLNRAGVDVLDCQYCLIVNIA